MEISNDSFTIVVDDKAFAQHPEARVTMEGAMAVLSYARITGEHQKLNVMLCQLLAHLMHEQKKPKGGWFGDKSSW